MPAPTRTRPIKAEELEAIPGVQKVSKIKPNRATVLYGPPGTGKTTLITTWPKPILYLDIRDKGTDSISDMPDEDMDVVVIEDSEQIDEILRILLRNIRKGTNKYKSVVFDTVTQARDMVVEEVAVEVKKKVPKGKLVGDYGVFTQQDWGKVASRLKGWTIDFRDLPLEVVFIAHQKLYKGVDEEDEGEGLAPEIGPSTMPSVASVLNAAVANIFNTYIRVKHIKKKDEKTGKTIRTEKKQYCLGMGPSSLYIRKIRRPKEFGPPPDFIVDPTYEDIIAIIKGE